MTARCDHRHETHWAGQKSNAHLSGTQPHLTLACAAERSVRLSGGPAGLPSFVLGEVLLDHLLLEGLSVRPSLAAPVADPHGKRKRREERAAAG